MLTTIFLVRHGEYEKDKDIVPFRLPGFPLNEKGKQQSLEIAQYLTDKNISAIYSSPLLRCKQTAKIIGNKLKLKPKYSRLILETRTPFQGAPKSKIKNWWSGVFAHPYHKKHGGETLEEIAKRTSKLIRKILQEHSGQNVLLVTHGDTSMVLIHHLVDADVNTYFEKTRPYIPQAGMVRFDFENNRLKNFTRINY